MIRQYSLTYSCRDTGDLFRFRRIDKNSYEREDGESFGMYRLAQSYVYVRRDRFRTKVVTTPNGFRIMVKRSLGALEF